MSDVIYLKTGQFSNRSFNASKKELKQAADALNILDDHGAMSNTTYTCDGISRPIFSVDVINEASSIANLANSLHEKLEAYSSLLQSGPDALRDADSSFKGEYTNAWQRGWYSISSGVSSVYNNTVSFWGSLFRKDGKKTGDKVPVVHEEENTREVSNPKPPKTEEPKELSPYEQYRVKADAAETAVPIGQKQEKERSGSGLCTYSATTTLLQRRQAVDGYDVTFTFGDVHRVNGGSGQVDPDGVWPDSSFAWGRSYTADSGETYQMREFEARDEESIKKLLDKHPEGIVVWSPSSGGYNHAIVITDYEINENGAMQFFADDPVRDRQYLNGEYCSKGTIVGREEAGRIPIDNTWLAEVNGNILGSAVKIVYLE